MNRRSLTIVLAIAVVLLANGAIDKANAGSGVSKSVKVCDPVKAVPACKPVKPLPPPKVQKPIKACASVDSCGKTETLHDRATKFLGRFRKHDLAVKEIYQDAPRQDTPRPVPTEAAPTPAPAPQSPAA